MSFHCDRAPIKSYELSPEGFLNYVAPIARVGWLTYRNLDGTTREEYVSAEVLKESANSFKMKPATLGHPPGGIVTPENAKQYQVGMTGHGVYFDNDFLWLTGSLTDAEAINAVTSGKAREISCGYNAKVSARGDGKFDQTLRAGNHIAVVERGRAGADVAFRIDSKDETWISDLGEMTTAEHKRGGKVKVKLDGKDFEIEDAELAVAVTAIASRFDSISGEKAALTVKLDALEGEKTALSVRIDEAEKARPTEEAIAVTIQERLDCWSLVLPHIRVDKADFNPDYALSPANIKTLYIRTKHPDIKLDGKSESFIDGLWEGLKPHPKSATDDAVSRADALFDSLNTSTANKDLPTLDGTDGDDAIAKARARRVLQIEKNSNKEVKNATN